MESYHASDGKAGGRSGGPVYKDRGSSSHGGRTGGGNSGGNYQSSTSSGRGLPRRGSSNSVGGMSRETGSETATIVIETVTVSETGTETAIETATDAVARVRGLETPVAALGSDETVAVAVRLEPEHPYVTDKLAMFPSVFPTNANFPEEKFRFHALRNAAYVSPLPRGFNQLWHLQYSAFTDKKLAIFDDLSRATRAICRLREGTDEAKSGAVSGAEEGAVAATAAVERAFTSYLIRHVRRLDDRTSHI
ncbi:hypothetical protein PInf_023845 [Phytophthora infestans]|nr:hypothetical protein PInf_023845 [Phytophthora infestans]